MPLKHTILGLLAARPMTGYDLKKIIQESPFMYWSGNNNQIYKSLLELENEGYVTNEVRHQESLPAKKIYTATEEGARELRGWAMAAPEPLEMKKPLLVRLAWSEGLSNEELLELLSDYEGEVAGQAAATKAAGKEFSLGRTPREAAVWELIYDNVAGSYAKELEWIGRARETVGRFDPAEYRRDAPGAEGREEKKMEMEMAYQAVEKNGRRYILFGREGRQIASEKDALEMMAACVENGANLLLIQGERLSDDFLRLRTGVAGAALQKMANYNIRAAAVLDSARVKGKFKELLAESNQGGSFRAFADFESAEGWLLE